MLNRLGRKKITNPNSAVIIEQMRVTESNHFGLETFL